jgi:ribosomal protein S10
MKKKYITLNFKTFNLDCFKIYKKFIQQSLIKLNLQFTFFNLPVTKKRLTMLKSPFVNKCSREQFEIKFYKGVIRINTDIEVSILKTFLINKPSTIQIRIKTE